MTTITVTKHVKCSPQDAWQLIGPFENIHLWFPGILDNKTKGQGVGATRQITMAEDAVFVDELTNLNNLEYSYKIIAGELPFTDYLGTVSVSEENGNTQLNYHATINVSDENKTSSVEFLTAIYNSAFENAKLQLESD